MSEFTILIVEDNPKNIQVLGNFIKETGYKTIFSTSGEDALLFLEKNYHNVDLILLDIMLPEMNGFEVCKTLKDRGEFREIPIIFITALNSIDEKIKGFDVGGVDYIVKPFLQQEVLARINVHVKFKEMLETYKRLSIIDDLTGIYNRRYAMIMIDREMLLSIREKKTFTICYMDLNNLKWINDQLGHDAGDQYIKDFSRILKTSIRNTDFAFRLGGDEFLILLPKSNKSNSSVIIDRIHSEIDTMQCGYLSFSYGFSEFNPETHTSIEDLLNEADNLMYKHKQLTKKEKKQDQLEKLSQLGELEQLDKLD